MWKFVIFYVLVALASACSSVKKVAVRKDVKKLLNESPVFTDQFTGFSLYDTELNEYLVNYNSDKRFTPASNTKLLTMYAVMKSFSDSIPALVYQKKGDNLYVSPTGDPTFLLSKFKNQKSIEFLKQSDSILIYWPKRDLEIFGNGWAWDDYTYDYQPQRSWWPIYGNTISVIKRETLLSVVPSFFTDYVDVLPARRNGEEVGRDIKFNIFRAFLESDTSNFERIIPFDYSKELIGQLLEDTLRRPVKFSDSQLSIPDTIFSHSVDFVLAMMMKPSDNFMAEQLLIQASWKNGFEDVRPFISKVKNTWLSNLNEFRWVDGSGLSRYNLISPNDQVKLLKLCYDEFGLERMKWILPKGGEGTLKQWYISDEPYVYAKTGTLSNNHNLSGYLITRSGKTMIFSLMNNHYIRSTTEVKMEMQKLLTEIRNAY